ncbi:MAG: M15 family metallopeptidase [Caryophanon sp.]|nr:M15 family metallopeptidase [Caryophanon sp.]
MTGQKRKMKTNAVIGASTVLALALVGGIYYTVTSGTDDVTPQQSATTATEETTTQAPNEIQNETMEVPEVNAPVTNEQTEELQQPNVEEQPTQKEVQPSVTDARQYIEAQAAATTPTYIDGILLANKQYPLPASYEPGVDPVAQEAVDEMIQAAKQKNIRLTAFSGFRSYAYQETLYTNYVARDGQAEADRYSARPGHSEHQTGLAFDIGEIGKEELWLTEAFGNTPAGKWLVDNAHEYGFILRYPRGKEHLTGFMYESWHFRYVGKDVAADIKKKNVTLEEYLDVAVTENDVEATSEEKMQVGALTEENR